MSTCIYTKKNFIILKINENSFIVYNKDKPFKDGHTHLNNYYIAKLIINYCLDGKLNKKQMHVLKSKYIQKSIERIK